MTTLDKKIYRPQFSTATDARVLRTREALRQALLELLQSRPFEQITIREIAATAGIGYTTFFRHHPGKESLLEEIAAQEMRELLEYLLSSFGAANPHEGSLALCNYVASRRPLWTTLLTGGAAGTLREEFVRISRQVAEEEASTPDWLPMDAAIVLISSGTIELLAWWLAQSRPLPAAAVATIFERVVLSPVLDNFRLG